MQSRPPPQKSGEVNMIPSIDHINLTAWFRVYGNHWQELQLMCLQVETHNLEPTFCYFHM